MSNPVEDIPPEEWLKNSTPGDILLEEFLLPLAMSQTALAKAIGVPPRRINEIVLGKRSVTADTDLRLSRYWGLSEGFWLRLQADHDPMEKRRGVGCGAGKDHAEGGVSPSRLDANRYIIEH